MKEKHSGIALPLMIKYGSIGALAVLFLAKTAYLLLTFHRGFDLGDEGMHLLLYKYPQEYKVTIYNHHYLVTALLPSSWINVFNLRVAWLTGELAGGIVLFCGCIAFMRGRGIKVTSTDAALFLLSGANALALSIHDRIIGYNSISNLLLNTSAGLLLFALPSKQYSLRNGWLIAGAFFLVAVQFFIKPTAALGALLLETILCLIFFKSAVLRFIPFAFSGAAVALVFMFTRVLPPFADWWPAYLKGAELAHLNGYGSEMMLVFMYGLPTAGYLALLLSVNAVVFLLLKQAAARYPASESRLTAAVITGHLLSSLAVWGILRLVFAGAQYSFEAVREIPDSFYSPVLLLPNTVVFQFFVSRIAWMQAKPYRISLKAASVCVFLLAVPYIIFFGAFSSFDVSVYGHLLPVIALLFLVPALFADGSLLPRLKFYYPAFAAALCLLLFVRNYTFYPTRLLEPLPKQAVNVGVDETVLMDSASAVFAGQVKHKVQQNGIPAYVTQIGMQPGLVYLSGAVQPGNCYYLSFSAISKELEQMNAAFNDYYYRENFNRIIRGPILINAGAGSLDKEAIDKRMQENGYRLALKDSVFNPYLVREMKANPRIAYPFLYVYYAEKL